MEQILSGTGHRPSKIAIGDQNAYRDTVYSRLVEFCTTIVERERPDRGISGMALGFDQALAEAFIRSGVPFTAAVPFAGQERRWPHQSQTRFREILAKADNVVVVCEGNYAAWKMQRRNEWMNEHATRVAALWNRDSSGGTANCVRHAESIQRPIVQLWNDWLHFIA